MQFILVSLADTLHQRVEEHKNLSSSNGKHFREKHRLAPKDLRKNLNALKNLT